MSNQLGAAPRGQRTPLKSMYIRAAEAHSVAMPPRAQSLFGPYTMSDGRTLRLTRSGMVPKTRYFVQIFKGTDRIKHTDVSMALSNEDIATRIGESLDVIPEGLLQALHAAVDKDEECDRRHAPIFASIPAQRPCDLF